MARTQVYLDRFTREGEFVVTKQGLKLGGAILPVGSVFPKDAITERRLRQLYDARFIGRPPGSAPIVGPPRRKPDYDGIIAAAFAAANARLAERARAMARPAPPMVAEEEHVPVPLEESLAATKDTTPAVEEKPASPAYSAADAVFPQEEALPAPETKADFLGRQAAATKKKLLKGKRK